MWMRGQVGGWVVEGRAWAWAWESAPFNISPLSFFRLAIAERIRPATERRMEKRTEKRFQNVAVRKNGSFS